MPAWAIPAISAGVSALGSFLSNRNRTPKFGSSEYAQYLRGIGKTGIYTPTVRNRILGSISRTAGNTAQQRTSYARGQLESRGMGRSIAGLRLLDRPGREAQYQVAEGAEKIETENELSKVNANESYARAMWENQQQRAQGATWYERLGQAGIAGYGAYMQSRQGGLKNMSQEQLLQWTQQQRDPDTALQMLIQLGYIQ